MSEESQKKARGKPEESPHSGPVPAPQDDAPAEERAALPLKMAGMSKIEFY